jgi:transcriptional regulator with XRE-family HTH domain
MMSGMHAGETAPAERSLGATLRDARSSRKMSLRAAAEGTGISYSSLCRIESGERDSAPLEALLRLGTKLGVPHATVIRLAGGLSPEGVRELTGGRVHGALRGGRLSPDAVVALRRVHIAALLEPMAGHIAGTPVGLRKVMLAAGLTVTETAGEPGFDVDGRYLVPQQHSPLERVVQRAWVAHGVAHALLADDAGERRSCTARTQLLDREKEATYLAMLILMPSAQLAASLRLRPLGPLVTGEDVAAVLDEIASDFDVPAGFAAARLAQDSVLAVMLL